MSTSVTYEDIQDFDSTYVYKTRAIEAVKGAYTMKPGKKKFIRLIKRASTPVPKGQGKQARNGD